MNTGATERSPLAHNISGADKCTEEERPCPEMKQELKYLLVFLALSCCYFYGVFLRGVVLAIGDGLDYFYPMMIVASTQYKDFMFPFWNPYMYSGFPLFGSMQPGVLYPPNIVLPLLFSPPLAFNLNLMLHYALAGFFAFLYARQIGLSRFPSLVTGTVFSFLGYLPSHLIHPSIITSGTWIPLILFFYERLRQDPDVKGALLGAMAVAAQVFAGHPQICFYTYLLLMLYVIFHLFYLEPPTRVRFVLFSTLSLVLGLLIALPQILATYELSSMGQRVKTTYDFFSSYAFPVHMLPSFLYPFFYYYGGSYDGDMWGPTPALGEEAFVGTLPFLLSIIVVARGRKNHHILFWGIIAILAFILALGDGIRPLNKLLFHIPFYNSFRGPSKHILEMCLALSILTGFGIMFLQQREKGKRFLAELIILLVSVIIVSLIAFTVLHDPLRDFIRNSFSHLHHFQLRWERSDIPETAFGMRDRAVYIPMLIMTVYLVCILVYLKTKKRNLGNAVLSLIFLVILAEAFLYKVGPLPDAFAVENQNKDLYAILAPDSSGRTIFFSHSMLPLSAMSHGISLVEGYDPLETGAYTKMLPAMYTQSPSIWRILLENNSLLSLMHARYLVVDNRVEGVEQVRWWVVREEDGGILPVPPAAMKPPNASGPVPVYRKVASFSSFSLYENTLALPQAYPVRQLKPTGSVDEFMQLLFSFRFNPWNEAAVSADDLREIGAENFSLGQVTIDEYRPNRVTLSVNFGGKGFLVLADQFYPGWEASIDGKAARIYKTNGVLRGVVVPEGRHVLIFSYVPRHIYVSMCMGGLLFAGTVFVLLTKGSRKPK